MPLYLRIYERVRSLRYIAFLPIGVIVALLLGFPEAIVIGAIVGVFLSIVLPMPFDEESIGYRTYTVDTFRTRLLNRLYIPGAFTFYYLVTYASIRFDFDIYDKMSLQMITDVADFLYAYAAVAIGHTVALLELTYSQFKKSLR